LYVTLLPLLMGINAAYYELILPYLAPHMVSMPRQALGLASLALGLLGVLFASVALVAHDETIDQWWQAGGPVVLIGRGIGRDGLRPQHCLRPRLGHRRGPYAASRRVQIRSHHLSLLMKHLLSAPSHVCLVYST
jgi:hypothetical protein